MIQKCNHLENNDFQQNLTQVKMKLLILFNTLKEIQFRLTIKIDIMIDLSQSHFSKLFLNIVINSEIIFGLFLSAI